MTPEIAQSIEEFVSWKVCIFYMVVAFGGGIYFLLNLGGNSRRRTSALIDLLWTLTSAASISSALFVFGDLVWKAHESRYEAILHDGYDQLSQLNSAELVALNCPSAKPVPDAQLDLSASIKAKDNPCLAASRISHWRQQLDEHTTEILKVCAKGDVHYKTRNFMGASSSGMLSSCSPTGEVTPCLQARCRQEQDVAAIALYIHVMGDKIKGDTGVDGFRKAIADAEKVPLRDVYTETHPFDPAPFFAFVPLWAALFGIRLARAVAEFFDPGVQGKGVRKSLKRSKREIRASTRRLWAKEKRRVREWSNSTKMKCVNASQKPPAT